MSNRFQKLLEELESLYDFQELAIAAETLEEAESLCQAFIDWRNHEKENQTI